jgi:hypothetical protein
MKRWVLLGSLAIVPTAWGVEIPRATGRYQVIPATIEILQENGGHTLSTVVKIDTATGKAWMLMMVTAGKFGGSGWSEISEEFNAVPLPSPENK